MKSRKVMRIITTIDMDGYSDFTNQQICETIAGQNGKDIAESYSILPGYIDTRIEVADEIVITKED